MLINFHSAVNNHSQDTGYFFTHFTRYKNFQLNFGKPVTHYATVAFHEHFKCCVNIVEYHNRQTDRQTDRQTHTHTHTHLSLIHI